MVIIVDQIKIVAGAASASAITGSNIMNVTWKEATNGGSNSMVPITVMNTINPVGWRQAHKWIEGSITFKSEENTMFTNYIKSTTAHVTIPYFTARAKTTTGTYITGSFTSTYVSQPTFSLNDNEEGLSTYNFVATSVAMT